MNISESVNRLNFWINKSTGAWYTIPEAVDVVDNGQLALYSDLQPKASTSQRIKDALSPFKDIYSGTTAGDGIITVPLIRNYLNLLDIQITTVDGSLTTYNAMEVLNEDERADALNSQIDPVTASTPIIEQIGLGKFQIYPNAAHVFKVSFYRRPVKPVFNFTVSGGRNIVYNPAGSIPIEFPENWHNAVLIKALSSIGINIGEQDISQFAEVKSQNNYQNVNNT